MRPTLTKRHTLQHAKDLKAGRHDKKDPFASTLGDCGIAVGVESQMVAKAERIGARMKLR